jgi:hypothetical protein
MIGPYYVNTEARRTQAWGSVCRPPLVTVQIGARQLKCHRLAAAAFGQWEQIRARHGYPVDGEDTGFYNCRRINHNPANPYSAHAWATALDVNWLTNPAGSKFQSDIPPKMRNELMAVRTTSGAYVFMWGGDWDRNPDTPHSFWDAMHWEVIAHPADLATGFAGQPAAPSEEDPMGLKTGDRSNAVRALQRHLADWNPALGLKDDGIYGQHTKAAVRTYQTAAGLPETGEADDTTLIHAYTNPFRNVEAYKRTLERMGI